jgi:lactate dehydrogenase-like 2-hydroxyacid dehydrogenase
MKIGYFGKQNSFALEMLRRLKLEQSRDEFLTWQPGDKAPSTELDVIIAFGKVDSKDIETQTKLGLLQMASAGYEGVDVDAGSTDLMLDGTAKYLGEVLARYRDGLRSEGIVNEPGKPRVPLRERLDQLPT